VATNFNKPIVIVEGMDLSEIYSSSDIEDSINGKE
jgi:hypothetical protein